MTKQRDISPTDITSVHFPTFPGFFPAFREQTARLPGLTRGPFQRQRHKSLKRRASAPGTPGGSGFAWDRSACAAAFVRSAAAEYLWPLPVLLRRRHRTPDTFNNTQHYGDLFGDGIHSL